MKEKIYTIPVNEAFQADTECAVCYMLARIEERAVNSLVGPDNSYMQSDIRAKTDKSGFCAKHFQVLFKYNNSLGLALMVETHLKRINKEMPGQIKTAKTSVKRGFLSKSTIKQSACAEYVKKQVCSCYICDIIENVFPMYMDTFIWLWKTEDSMKNAVKNGKGFCLQHFSLVMDTAAGKLSESEYEVFGAAAVAAQIENFRRIGEEVSWFVQKFDYRFKDEPWLNSRDSIQRAILKLSSTEVIK
jgi:hypothetical protein